ncbi:MAG: tannase/feruloyl esterase family alpha/beta hydrolase [Rhodospirillaceae bacterium]|nr:tannase/feruloyl esterase family alpha/beta hydrolase [Rhodospirillaceae bacterium]MBT5567207.1 tannase/feruloyl esterase family alpha/beta hydrolase [Rhodospirillaceae bacterium]
MMNRIARCFFGSLLFFGQSSGSEAQTINTESCKALAAKSFEYAVGVKVTITKANVVPANGVSQPAHCHILATVAPSNGIEIQLPLSGWNGRMLFTGCGGLCGVIRTDQGSDALARNYAVATSDMGHRLGPGEDPRAWTLNEELVEEWQHRATHTATLLAKAVIATAYGREQDYAYFRGCSTGGRQGLTEALMYPNDYDGVIAGAPAAQMVTPNNVFAYASNTRADGTSILTADAITLLADAVLSACDMDDGVKDGVLGNPGQCTFKPETLRCEGPLTDRCLTDEQIDAANKVYDGARKADGSSFYAMGYAKGSERDWIAGFIGANGRGPRRAGSAQFTVERKIGPDATLADFDYAKHGVSGSPVGGLMDFGSDGKKLKSYINDGGKIILYHGWSDTDATPASSFFFYNAQAEAFGDDNLPDFLRMFLLPGMKHCRGGNGVNTADYLDEIEGWVEEGDAPESLDVYGATEDPFNYIAHPLDPSTIVAGRKIFPYPASSVYDGSGDVVDPQNWIKK